MGRGVDANAYSRPTPSAGAHGNVCVPSML